MTASSIGRILLLSVALVAGCVAALLFDLRREPALETSTAPAASTPSQPASGARDQGSLTTGEARATATAAEPAIPPGSPVTDKSVPVFDIARIEPTGDAVIAGRAAPGAIVDLLRNGERLERVVADPSGQFVMAPLRLPRGSYELTLSARSPDGAVATSKQGVVVALDEAKSNSVAVQSRAAAPLNVPEAATTKGLSGLSLDDAVRSAQARLLSQPRVRVAKRQDDAVSRLPHAIAAASPSDGPASSPVGGPRILTRVVSPGDSLWRISRVTYGAGTQYVVVYRANRDQIRNPNLIYPGQVFVLPMKAR